MIMRMMMFPAATTVAWSGAPVRVRLSVRIVRARRVVGRVIVVVRAGGVAVMMVAVTAGMSMTGSGRMAGLSEVDDVQQIGGDAAAFGSADKQVESFEGNGAERVDNGRLVGAGVYEAGKEHVAGDAELTIKMEMHGNAFLST